MPTGIFRAYRVSLKYPRGKKKLTELKPFPMWHTGATVKCQSKGQRLLGVSLFRKEHTNAGWISGILHFFSTKKSLSSFWTQVNMLVSDLRHKGETLGQEKNNNSRSIDIYILLTNMNVIFGNNILKWLILESLTDYPWK